MRTDQITFTDEDGKKRKPHVIVKEKKKAVVKEINEQLASEAEQERQAAEAQTAEEEKRETLRALKNRRQDMDDRRREAEDRLDELKGKRAAMQAGFRDGDPDDRALLLEILKAMLDVETYQIAKEEEIDKRCAELDPGHTYGKFKKAF